MTCEDLYNACKKHDFLLLRTVGGGVIAVNTRCVEVAKRRTYSSNRTTVFISYRPCNFQTYITYKQPFNKDQKKLKLK